jgi:predicted DNA-binding transcriptional regulator YafY
MHMGKGPWQRCQEHVRLGHMRRKPRLFAITEHLRARRSGVTAEELARRFGVTIRTIYRDLDTLREASLPLRADRGRGGGYALDRSYTLPPVNFTAREAAVLVAVGRWAIQTRLFPFSDTVESALDKVRGALSRSAQRDLLQLLDGLQFLGIPAAPVSPAVRREVEQAWFEGKPLHIRYRSSRTGLGEHTVRIESVLMERTFTLLSCQDLQTNTPRTFRLDRIESARPDPG